MRTLEDVQFILARVLAHIETHPALGPLLAETPPRAPRERCGKGHEGFMVQRAGRWRCSECERLGKARRRAAGSAAVFVDGPAILVPQGEGY